MQKNSHLSVLLGQDQSHPAGKEKMEAFITGLVLANLNIVDGFQDVERVEDLIKQINTAVEQKVISKMQRHRILEKAIKVRYQNVSAIEQAFLRYVSEENSGKSSDYFEDQIPVVRKQQQSSVAMLNQLLEREKKAQRQRKLREQEQSLRLIKEIQLSQMGKLGRFSSTKSTHADCPICLESIELRDFAGFSCSHSFHQHCVAQYFQQAITQRNFPLKCPGCSKQCCQSDLREYLDPALMKKYQKLSFQSFVHSSNDDMSWCPSPGCQYVFFFTEQLTEFHCPVCFKQYCLTCKVNYHKGMTCKQFSINRVHDDNDTKFIEFVKGAKYKQCPSCFFWVEKNQGCDHMTCRCKFQFCYVCGAKHGTCGCKKTAGGLFGGPVAVAPRAASNLLLANQASNPQPRSLFGNPPGLFSNPANSLFLPQPNVPPSLFGSSGASSNNLFSNHSRTETYPNLFKLPQNPSQTGSLFGTSPHQIPSSSRFPSANNTSSTSTKSFFASGSLFSN